MKKECFEQSKWKLKVQISSSRWNIYRSYDGHKFLYKKGPILPTFLHNSMDGVKEAKILTKQRLLVDKFGILALTLCYELYSVTKAVCKTVGDIDH